MNNLTHNFFFKYKEKFMLYVWIESNFIAFKTDYGRELFLFLQYLISFYFNAQTDTLKLSLTFNSN